MGTPVGRYKPVSHFRRMVADLLHFSSKVPSVTVERRIDLSSLMAARGAATPSPTWSSIFTKAYSVVSRRTPSLRTSYLTFPWPRFYEHFSTIATVNVHREVAGEDIIIYAHICEAENLSLPEIDSIISEHRRKAPWEIPSYYSAVYLSRVPWPFRRLIWWATLNFFGSIRCYWFGTFGVTSIGQQGAGIVCLTPLLTSQLHYGMIDENGRTNVRFSFDHRVLDGVAAAGVLADLEAVLLGQMADECAQMEHLPTPSFSHRNNQVQDRAVG